MGTSHQSAPGHHSPLDAAMDRVLGALVTSPGDKEEWRGVEETARLILSTATSDSSSVTVNYLVPIVLFAIPVLYFVFRLGLFNLDDSLGSVSGIDLSGYNAPAAGYGAPAPSYNAPAPSYNAPAPSYNAAGAGISSSAGLINSGAYFSSKEDEQLNLEYISQINSELDQLRRIRDLLQGGGGRLSLGSNDQIVVHPSPRLDLTDATDTWNG